MWGHPQAPKGWQEKEAGELRQREGGMAECFPKHWDSCRGGGGEPSATTPKGHDPQAAASVRENERDLGQGQEGTGRNPH